jgi:hypothetical protein
MRIWSRNVNPIWNDSINVWIGQSIAARSQFTFAGPDERIWLKAGDNGAAGTSDGSHYSTPFGNDLCALQWLSCINPRPAVVQLAPRTISVGNVLTRRFKDTVLSISNVGTQPLQITSVISNNTAFTVKKSSMMIDLGQAFLDTIIFAPSAAGPASGLLFLFSNTMSSPDTVGLDGVGIVSSIEERGNEIPQRFFLYHNFPNPFNPTTKIRYELPTASFVTLDVCDMLGRNVVTIVAKHQAAGFYAVPFDGSALMSGVYFYRLRAGDFFATKKMVLLK